MENKCLILKHITLVAICSAVVGCGGLNIQTGDKDYIQTNPNPSNVLKANAIVENDLPVRFSATSWRETDNAPRGVGQLGWGTASLPDGDVLGVATASDGNSSLGFLYNTKTNRWSATASVPGVRALGVSLHVLKNGTVLAFGVGVSDKKIKAEIFDPASSQWQAAGELPDNIGWQRQIVRLSDKRFLLLSGQPGAQWLYDSDREEWSKTADVPEQIRGIEFTLPIGGGSALVVFRDTTLSGCWLGMVYDSAHDVWITTKPLPSRMCGSPTGHMMLADGSIIMIGYQETPTIAYVSIIFHPKDRSWMIVGPLPDEAHKARISALLPDGKVLAIDPVSVSKMRGWLFDPVRRAWMIDGDLPDGYQGATNLRTLNDGTMWAMGYRNNVDRDELVYTPSQHTWTVKPMPQGVFNFCFLPAQDGAVLLFLAADNNIRSLIQGAVIFRP